MAHLLQQIVNIGTILIEDVDCALKHKIGEEKFKVFQQRRDELMHMAILEDIQAQPDFVPADIHTAVHEQASFWAFEVAERVYLSHYKITRLTDIASAAKHYVFVRTSYHGLTEEAARSEFTNLVYLFGGPAVALAVSDIVDTYVIEQELRVRPGVYTQLIEERIVD